jgi:hypothetical protein
MALTVVLTVFVTVLCVYILVRTAFWSPGPLVALMCWGGALAIMFRSLREILPAVREAESAAQKGFAVIPVARVAEPAVPDSDADAAGKPAG